MHHIEPVPVHDTAGAARMVAEAGRLDEAAIASVEAANRLGLIVLAERIQTYPDNFTKFAVVGTRDAGLGTPDKTSLVMAVADRPGSLLASLQPFAERGVNMVKLESRPRRGAPFEYVFYVDIERAADDPDVRAAFDAARLHTSMLKVLGSYRGVEGSRVGEGRGRLPTMAHGGGMPRDRASPSLSAVAVVLVVARWAPCGASVAFRVIEAARRRRREPLTLGERNHLTLTLSGPSASPSPTPSPTPPDQSPLRRASRRSAATRRGPTTGRGRSRTETRDPVAVPGDRRASAARRRSRTRPSCGAAPAGPVSRT